MSEISIHVRHALLYEFELDHSAAEAHRNIVRALGADTVSSSTCQAWFRRFRSGDHSLEDHPRSGRPLEVDLDILRQLIEANPHETIRSLALTLGCSYTTVDNALHVLGKVQKFGRWIPHQLSESNLHQRVECCLQLLSRSRRFDWLDNVVTGDEKWCLYVNHTRKRQWVDAQQEPQPEPKSDLHPKKVMLCIWWGVRGIYHWELLPSNMTITAEVYTAQLRRLAEKLSQLNPQLDKVLLLHDNARPHVAKLTRLEILRIGWEVLPHAPYSPDLAPSDYHLFRSLNNHLSEKKFDNRSDLERDLAAFFCSQSADFWTHGIRCLPERWRQVVDNDGTYILD
jgi:histone-lysine N-methyltransferase SETMAR